MSTRLVILGLLREQPRHGYELKALIEEQMGAWTSIAFGSIYHALEKLSTENNIKKIATEQDGGRPSRNIYQITPAGEEEFTALLRGLWDQVERVYHTIDIGIYFLDALPATEVTGYLYDRLAALETALHHRHVAYEKLLSQENAPMRELAILDHTLTHLRAEITWTRNVVKSIREGAFPTP